MFLPARNRLDPSAKKRVHDAAQTQKIEQSSGASGNNSDAGLCIAGHVSPSRWNVKTAAVRQSNTQFQCIKPLLPPDDPQHLPIMGVALTGDRHMIWEALVKGSLR
jgi:hypothetical protein